MSDQTSDRLAEIRVRDAEWRKLVEQRGVKGPESAEDRSALLAEVDRLQARLSQVERLRVVSHGCGGNVMKVVFAKHLHAALGLTPDGKAADR